MYMNDSTKNVYVFISCINFSVAKKPFLFIELSKYPMYIFQCTYFNVAEKWTALLHYLTLFGVDSNIYTLIHPMYYAM